MSQLRSEIVPSFACRKNSTLRKARLQRGWSIRMLSVYSDVPRSIISKAEATQTLPEEPYLSKLSEVFGITPEQFTTGNFGARPISPSLAAKELPEVVEFREHTQRLMVILRAEWRRRLEYVREHAIAPTI